MSVFNSIISRLRSAFSRLCRAIWRVIQPAPPLVIYVCVPSRMRPREACKNQCTTPCYAQTANTEVIENTNPTGNNGHINQAMDISEEENQHEMVALGSHEAATIQTEADVHCLEAQTQV